MNKPLIVLQGANDPRVLQVKSDEIAAALKLMISSILALMAAILILVPL